jgi:hypothetical protein
MKNIDNWICWIIEVIYFTNNKYLLFEERETTVSLLLLIKIISYIINFIVDIIYF